MIWYDQNQLLNATPLLKEINSLIAVCAFITIWFISQRYKKYILKTKQNNWLYGFIYSKNIVFKIYWKIST